MSDFDRPSDIAFLITASDSVNITNYRGISFTTAGTIVAEMKDGSTVTIPSGALAVGIIHPFAPQKIKTASTAAGFVGWR
jgi:hypothetical protein